MAWALWLDPQHRAAKMHVHFDVLRGVPVETTVTTGNGSETEQLRATLQAQRLYVLDRGYVGQSKRNSESQRSAGLAKVPGGFKSFTAIHFASRSPIGRFATKLPVP
jgi:hypothetical protein